MRCLFLGYNSSQTRLINFLKKKKILITHKKKVVKKGIEKFDLIVSFGCRQIIKSDILRKVKRPILNLHMSYLPFNKGSYPNFWSFSDNTKKGVTIHEMDKNLDTGAIIFQKEIKFNIQKDKKITFKNTYNILFSEIEKLFIKNYKSIIFNKYRKKKNDNLKGKINYIKDLPKDLGDWNTSIFHYFKNTLTYKKMYTKFYQKLVWQINNDIDSRMYSRRTKFIKYSQHLKWFERTLKNKEYSIYLVKKDKTNIGIIRQNKKKNKIFLSWALRRKFKGKNLGVKLVKEFIKKNNNTFFAEVHKLDIRSIKICKKIGFEFLKKEDDFLLFKKNKL
jgi:folate-dependent phosphoribosylglycinamide formyltransferase PurN/RimJ/RimL family protein N-acetyltransferase